MTRRMALLNPCLQPEMGLLLLIHMNERLPQGWSVISNDNPQPERDSAEVEPASESIDSPEGGAPNQDAGVEQSDVPPVDRKNEVAQTPELRKRQEAMDEMFRRLDKVKLREQGFMGRLEAVCDFLAKQAYAGRYDKRPEFQSSFKLGMDLQKDPRYASREPDGALMEGRRHLAMDFQGLYQGRVQEAASIDGLDKFEKHFLDQADSANLAQMTEVNWVIMLTEMENFVDYCTKRQEKIENFVTAQEKGEHFYSAIRHLA